MDEARRFLRYVTPGLTFIIFLCFFLYLSNQEIFIKTAKEISKEADIGLPVALLIASGGLGFFFSIVHHFLIWWIYAPIKCSALNKLTMDYRKALISAESQGQLILQSQQGDTIEAARLTIAGAWRVFTAIWQERVDESPRFKGADSRTTSLCDLMHGSGAALVACVASVIIWMFIQIFVICSAPSFWSCVVALLLVLIHLLNYIFLVAHSLGVTQMIMLDELQDPSEENAIRPVVVVVSDRELRPLPSASSQ
jgi:hypothetical protein